MNQEAQQRILGYFIEEARDHLTTIEQGLLSLRDSMNDPELINELFRAAHSIKGGSAMLGLSSIQRIAHRMEDFFNIFRSREGRVPVDQHLETLLLQGFDTLSTLLEQLQGPNGLPESVGNAALAEMEPIFAETETHIYQLLGEAAPASAKPAPPKAAPAPAAAAPKPDLQVALNQTIPQHLREMVELFKQKGGDVRAQLAQVGEALYQIGVTHKLAGWQKLTRAVCDAIANPGSDLRSLALISLRDLKHGRQALMAGNADQVEPSAELVAMAQAKTAPAAKPAPTPAPAPAPAAEAPPAMTEAQKRILGFFLEEARDHLTTIEQSLLSLQTNISDPEFIEELFRAAHSIKGGSAQLGLSAIQKITHRMEDIFSIFRNHPGQIPADQHLESLMLRAYDTLSRLIEEVQEAGYLSESSSQAAVAETEPILVEAEAHVDRLMRGESAAPEAVEPPVAVPEPVAAAPVPTLPTSQVVLAQEIPRILKEMLALFKQPDHPNARHGLQQHLEALHQIGADQGWPQWQALVQVASDGVARPDLNLRDLALPVLRDLKAGHQALQAGQPTTIQASAELLAFVPPPAADMEFEVVELSDTALAEAFSEAGDLLDGSSVEDLMPAASLTGGEELAGADDLGWGDLDQDLEPASGLELELEAANLGLSEPEGMTESGADDWGDLGSLWMGEPDQSEATESEGVGADLGDLGSWDLGGAEAASATADDLATSADLGDLGSWDLGGSDAAVEAEGLTAGDDLGDLSSWDMAGADTDEAADLGAGVDLGDLSSWDLPQETAAAQDLEPEAYDLGALDSWDLPQPEASDTDLFGGDSLAAAFDLGESPAEPAGVEQDFDAADLFGDLGQDHDGWAGLGLEAEEVSSPAESAAAGIEDSFELPDLSGLGTGLESDPVGSDFSPTPLELGADEESAFADIFANAEELSEIEEPSLDLASITGASRRSLESEPDSAELSQRIGEAKGDTDLVDLFGDLAEETPADAAELEADLSGLFGLEPAEASAELDPVGAEPMTEDSGDGWDDLLGGMSEEIPADSGIALSDAGSDLGGLDFESLFEATDSLTEAPEPPIESVAAVASHQAYQPEGEEPLPATAEDEFSFESLFESGGSESDDRPALEFDDAFGQAPTEAAGLMDQGSADLESALGPEGSDDLGGLGLDSLFEDASADSGSEQVGDVQGSDDLDALDLDSFFGDAGADSGLEQTGDVQASGDSEDLDAFALDSLFGETPQVSEWDQAGAGDPFGSELGSAEAESIEASDASESQFGSFGLDRLFDETPVQATPEPEASTPAPELESFDLGSSLESDTSDTLDDFGKLDSLFGDEPDHASLSLDASTSSRSLVDTDGDGQVDLDELSSFFLDDTDTTAIPEAEPAPATPSGSEMGSDFDDELSSLFADGFGSEGSASASTEPTPAPESGLHLDDLAALFDEGDEAPASAPEAPVDDLSDLDLSEFELDLPLVETVAASAAESAPTAAVVDALDAELDSLLEGLEFDLEPSTPTPAPAAPAPAAPATPTPVPASSVPTSPYLPDSARKPATTGRRPSTAAFSNQTMRVEVRHLDTINNLVGELVVNRNSLEQNQGRLRQFLDGLLDRVQQLTELGQRMQDQYDRSLLESALLASRGEPSRAGALMGAMRPASGDHASGREFDALEMDRFTAFHAISQEMIELIVRVRESSSDIQFGVDETEQITRQFRQVTTQLQEGLNRARMVPFSQISDRLPRAIRDLSIKTGKQVNLNVEGRDTLIDKAILEELYDPMTHLVNNALVHGIETPEARRGKGKSPEGKISVNAFYQGNQTIIVVSDDGGGINVEKVKAKALKLGLIQADAIDDEVYNVLFHPGFSGRSAEEVDDLAGRGVGLDVVRRNITELRGSIQVDSIAGQGTTFTIRLPLTLSISKAMVCISDRALIAFPLDGVEEMLDIPNDEIEPDEKGRPSIPWRDRRLHFQPLSELLGYSRTHSRSRSEVYSISQEEGIVPIVILQSAGQHVALQVDSFVEEQEIVIKQLRGPVLKPPGIAGATVLGNGRVLPIADIIELVDMAQGRMRRDIARLLGDDDRGDVVQSEPEHQTTVLIVDDSITVRELLSMTFNKVGYRVEQARDGQDAWEKLRGGLPCDLIFCDIEMPRMDGLELLSRIREDPALQERPIAMLTSRGAERHRRTAQELGATAYFTKPYLEEELLSAASRMLKGEVLLA